MKTTASALEFKQARLENGLTVIAEVNPEAKSAALGYFVKTGSRDETAELIERGPVNGLSLPIEGTIARRLIVDWLEWKR